MNMAGDHVIPFFCLFVDYCFNGVPFCYRHLPFVMLMGIFYLLVNLIATKVRGDPVYPQMDWKTPIGFAYIFGAGLANVLLFIIVKLITDFKLIRNGHGAIVGSQKDRLYVRKTTNINALAKEKDAFGVYNHYQPSRLQSVQVPTAMGRNNSFMASANESGNRMNSYAGGTADLAYSQHNLGKSGGQ